MNCSQANTRFVDYLGGEITASETAAMQAHLMGCASCREELERLTRLETRLTEHLNLKAERVALAPQAWNRLQRRISQEGTGGARGGFRSITNRFLFEQPAARRLALALLVILVLLWTVPPVRTLAARVGDWVGSWFEFKTPGTGSTMGIGGFEAFTPYAPQYLPEGFDSSGSGGATAPDLDQLSLTYSRDEMFVTVIQSAGAGAGGLPIGEYVYLSGIAAIFVPEFAASSADLQQKIPSIPIIQNLDYGTTSLLAWYDGKVKIELVSNLPEGEILKIARSLKMVESGGGGSSRELSP